MYLVNDGPQGNEYTSRGRRGRDCMAVGVTTTFAISAYHH